MGMGQNQTIRGPHFLVHVSINQGNLFWAPIFDPQPDPPGHVAAGAAAPGGAVARGRSGCAAGLSRGGLA